jgi:4a-hydroxytetrahydrobiopterin dehydratase
MLLVLLKLNHHATITNTYNTVELWLCTHDAGNVVTQKDIEMAAEIDKVI